MYKSKRFMVLLTFLSVSLVLSITMKDIQNMPANSWLEVPNTHMADLTLPESYLISNGIYGVQGPEGIMKSWGGGAYDTKRDRLVVWGGGHNDYYGNDLYAFELNSMKWTRLTDPTPNPSLNNDINWDGTPQSRHTYNGLAYIQHADRFFGLGGSIASSGSANCRNTWTFYFVTKQWKNMKPSGQNPVTHVGNCCVYDPLLKEIWWGEANYYTNPGLYSYDYDSNTWTKHVSGLGKHFYEFGMALDTKRRHLYTVKSGEFAVYDIGKSSISRQVISTSGSYAHGKCLEYDPVADKLVGFSGDAVYALDPVTRTWTTYNPPGSPGYPSHYPRNGLYGRWRYVPSVNAFITVMSIHNNVHFFKLTAGGGTAVEETGVRFNQPLDVSVNPNPFNGTVKVAVSYQLSAFSNVQVSIHNINGRQVKKLTADSRPASPAGGQGGQLTAGITWNASNLPAGIYIVRLTHAGKTFSKKIFLTR